ncbi:MAG TPA: polysaccharide deacetylase family protein [Stellaceae bacterium]|jgi:hypothetical protein
MIDLPRDTGTLVTVAGWRDLEEELELWEETGRVATLWWRDDDATVASGPLDRLLALADGVPLALAVIPATAEAGLAWRLARTPLVALLQHGWCHLDHATDRKKSEFPPGRPSDAVAADLVAGRARLGELFGATSLAVLAPPWNRFDDGFLPLLADCGIGAISRVKPRPTAWPVPGVLAVNVHVDLVAWRGDRGFIGEEAALGGIVEHLRGRRLDRFDCDEPTGILTHHLVQDERTAAFLARLLAMTRGHRAARWLDAREAFAAAECNRA